MKSVSLEQIKKPLTEALAAYGRFMRAAVVSDSPYFNEILDYVFDNSGKGIRPTLTLLFAGIESSGRSFDDRNYLAATLVELIHTASLVHDDVVDDATVRHGKPSVNKIWGKRNSIITGDFILAKILETGMQSGQYDILTYVSHGIKSLCEGEVIQDEQSRSLEMTREKYFEIINKKTAVLIAISCGVGAVSSHASAVDADRAYEIGRCLGMAFQIKDDILDYAATDQTGKPQCADLREHKITLPLLTLLEESTDDEKELLKSLVRESDSHENSINVIRSMVARSGGPEKAEAVANDFLDRARTLIAEYPPSPYRTSLEQMCDYLAERTK